jgi:hypothetical protein
MFLTQTISRRLINNNDLKVYKLQRITNSRCLEDKKSRYHYKKKAKCIQWMTRATTCEEKYSVRRIESGCPHSPRSHSLLPRSLPPFSAAAAMINTSPASPPWILCSYLEGSDDTAGWSRRSPRSSRSASSSCSPSSQWSPPHRSR